MPKAFIDNQLIRQLSLTPLIMEIQPRDPSMDLYGINTCLGFSEQLWEVCLHEDKGTSQENSSQGKKSRKEGVTWMVMVICIWFAGCQLNQSWASSKKSVWILGRNEMASTVKRIFH